MFDKFAEAIQSVDVDAYSRGSSSAGLLISQDGGLSVEYAPFDHVELEAELVIVGLTPGRVQAANALRAVQVALKSGMNAQEALGRAKRLASFSGPKRTSLVAMLNQIGVAGLFGRASASDFFENAGRVHFTSALRYPVYLKGRTILLRRRRSIHQSC